MSLQYQKVKQVLKYLNSSNREQNCGKFLEFLQDFSRCPILITVKRYSYLNQLHQDIILVSDLREYIIQGDTSDPIFSAHLSNQIEIEDYFEKISRFKNGSS